MKIIEQIYSKDYSGLLKRPSGSRQQIDEIASRIIKRVEEGGDVALRAISKEIDGKALGKMEVTPKELEAASKAVSPELKDAIDVAIKNIEAFHRAQLPNPVQVETMPGVRCSVRYEPIPRIGLYIPGGTAPLFSTVLMTAIPATLAGCTEIIACTPPGASPEILYAFSLFNIKPFYLGGAQAIAAMAFGTESIPKVDKIFGPGNAYVTSAKMQMAGRGIAIDMPAGPSEVMVIADHTAVPAFVASDLLSQAEHGPDSQAILVATSMDIINKTMVEIRRQLEVLPRKITAARSLHESIAICATSMEQAIEISNYYGPEHLILAVEDYNDVAESIKNAGSVFLGNYSPETAGDYASGTNHILPTYGFTRAWSGITIQSFMKSISFQEISIEGLTRLAPSLVKLARAEKLEAHASAVVTRTGEPEA